MKAKLAAACALLLAIGAPASAHRVDEYLQATTISMEQHRVQAQMRLTPGVAVFHRVFGDMDANRDGILSEAEQKGYAERVIQDLSLTVDGSRLPLRLISSRFAATAEMKEGRGEIQLDFQAETPQGGPDRRLVFENHHQSRIGVYLVNCLVPSDPTVQVTGQKRNYQQSRYELDYTQAVVRSEAPFASLRSGNWGWLCAAALLLIAPFAWFWRRLWGAKI
jgi:hypothetical protein